MADRYWVGGAGTWNSTNTANWSATSGGAGGASVPTSTDDVFFDQAATYTVTLSTTASMCRNFTCSAGPVTFAGTSGAVIVTGSFSLVAGTVWSATGTITFSSGTTGNTVTTNGVSVAPTGGVTFNGTGNDWTLLSALTTTGSITVTRGTLTTNNYNITATQLSSSNSNTRAINLGSSTITLSSGINFSTSSGLTFNAGTSQIKLTSTSAPSLSGGGLAFYNIAYTGLNWTSTGALDNVGSANNISVTGRTASGLNVLAITADCSINGALTLSAGTVATMRTFVQSNTIGTPRTLTVNNFAAGSADIDFRDITIAGAAAPISGTRFGDCKGNSGVTFPAAKTVYWRVAAGGNWGAASWSSTIGGTADVTQMPLAQDTAVFPSLYPNSASTATVNASYNIGTIDMSARTTNTMTLATGSTTPAIYGNWINGTGATLSGTGNVTFAGRSSQTITSVGVAFANRVTVDSPGGSFTLQDALSITNANLGLTLTQGTFNANNYNVTISGTSSGFASSGTGVRTLALGSGTWSVTGGNNWNTTNATNLTVTGTGTISMVSASSKSFSGGNVQTYPTINQGGTGTLTVSGSNKFAGLTNTAIGRIQFTGGTTNEFTSFSINGTAGNLLPLGSSNTTQAILKRPSDWNVGANSTDAGNNTGLSFTAGSNDYLSVSYINGQIAAPASTIYYGATNITNIRFGSAAVSAVYYGSTKVF